MVASVRAACARESRTQESSSIVNNTRSYVSNRFMKSSLTDLFLAKLLKSPVDQEPGTVLIKIYSGKKTKELNARRKRMSFSKFDKHKRLFSSLIDF